MFLIVQFENPDLSCIESFFHVSNPNSFLFCKQFLRAFPLLVFLKSWLGHIACVDTLGDSGQLYAVYFDFRSLREHVLARHNEVGVRLVNALL